MKKFLALLLAVSLLVLTGSAYAATPSTGGHVIQIDPTPPTPTPGGEDTPTPSTGSNEAKTVEAPTAAATETKTVTVTTTTTTTATVQTFTNAAEAAVKVVKTVTKTETKQTVAQATEKNKVTTISTTQVTQVTTAVTAVIADTKTESGAAVVDTDTGEVSDTTALASALLGAVNETTGSTVDTTDESAVSAAASTTAIASSLLKGNTGSSGSDTPTTTGNLSNITDKAQVKEDGTTETLAETLVRLINETITKAAEVLTSATTSTNLTTLFNNSASSSSTPAPTVAVEQATDLQSANTTKTVTNADGSTSEVTNDEAPSFEDVMSMLSQQTAEEVVNANSGGTSEEQTKANTKQAELQRELPVAVVPPVTPPRPGIYMLNMPTMKPDTYRKPINLRTLKNDRRGGGSGGRAFMGAALDANEDGSGTFLNSLGNVITRVPGEDEWEAPADDPTGEEMLVIPGYVTVAMYMIPNVDYTPVITTTSEAISDVVETAAEEEDFTVVEESTVELDVPVYVASDDSYSTSFDVALTEYFEAEPRNYNTTVGYFIVSGDAGVWAADSPEYNAALAALHRAIVRTLPKLDVRGVHASDTAQYVMQVRFDIPRNNDTQEVTGDDLLNFYPKGFEFDGGTVRGNYVDAIYLDATGRAPLTDAKIRAIAAGTDPDAVELSDETMGYTGYIVMPLDKLSDDEEAYTPLITVRVTDIRAADSDDFVVRVSPSSTVSVQLGDTETLTLTPSGNTGTVTYGTPSASWVTVSGSTVTIAPTDEALIASSPNTVTITATDTGRTEDNTYDVTLTITVTERGTGGSLGGSGGGCSAGWSVLALAVLGGLIKSRKK